MKTKTLNLPFVLVVALLFASATSAQTYPSKPVTVIVPFSAAGTTDIVARVIANELTGSLGRPVLVDNRTGGGGVIGWGAAAKAAPDGHTLLALELSYPIAATLVPNLPFDPRKSFVPITIAASVAHVVVVHPSLRAKTAQEFIAFAKANPGKLHYGSGGVGSGPHLGAELFKSLAGVNIVHVPYKGAGAVLQDVMAGYVQMLVSTVTTSLPHIRSGKLRALMVTSEERNAALSDVASAPEAGLPKMIVLFFTGYAVPAGTPQPVLDRLHKEIVAALGTAETRKRLGDLGLDIAGTTPAQAAKFVEGEIQKWAAVIKAANIKAE